MAQVPISGRYLMVCPCFSASNHGWSLVRQGVGWCGGSASSPDLELSVIHVSIGGQHYWGLPQGCTSHRQMMKKFFKKPSERLELSTGETSRCLTLPEEPDVDTKSEVKRTHGHLFIIRYLWDQQADGQENPAHPPRGWQGVVFVFSLTLI